MQIEPRALEMMQKKKCPAWKMLQYWCYMMITYAIITFFVYLATYKGREHTQIDNVMSNHVEIKRGGQWQSWKVLAQF